MKYLSFQERKEMRKRRFLDEVHGCKLRTCAACNGSGRYDHNGSPKCATCDGTGRERYKPMPSNS